MDGHSTSSFFISFFLILLFPMSRCWICFDDDAHDGWAKPCSCTLIAHEQCLLDWISETEKTAPYTAIRCPQCAMPYKIVDTVSTTLRMLWKVVYIVQIMIPVFTILCVSFTTLITSTAYGALTIIMFLGTEQSEQLMGPTVQWTWRTWATMPLIPMVLVACCFRWSDGILPLGTVLLLHGAGNPVHHIRLAWPPSLHAVLGIFPWIRLLYNILFHVAQYRLPLRVLKNSSSGDGGRDSTMSRSDIRLLVGDHQRYIGVSIIGALLLPMIGTLIAA
ncbi:hypothetical protein BX666DRAFT_840389 [Dichotomocladium elegans]|nr:hypothetical protein BX666DRAFT_840389 [Dichotomocladium elegans]